jgi:uncharacterized membrane protein YvbJ
MSTQTFIATNTNLNSSASEGEESFEKIGRICYASIIIIIIIIIITLS